MYSSRPKVLHSHAAGNEANVEVYANFTGFLWETAKDFNALVVFAEVCGLLQAPCCSPAQHHVCAIAVHLDNRLKCLFCHAASLLRQESAYRCAASSVDGYSHSAPVDVCFARVNSERKRMWFWEHSSWSTQDGGQI